MKIPGPTEISAVRAGVAQEPESDSRTRALSILDGALDERHAAARTCANCGSRMSPRWPRTRVGNELWCPACAQNAPRQYSPYAQRTAEHVEAGLYHSGGKEFPGTEDWVHVGTREAALNRAKDWNEERSRRGESAVPVYLHTVRLSGKHSSTTETDDVVNQPGIGAEFLKNGHTAVPYINEYEDPGTVSYLAHRSAVHLLKTEPISSSRHHAKHAFGQEKTTMPLHALNIRYAVRRGIGTLPLGASPQQGLAYFLAADKPHIVRVAHDSGSTEIIYHCPFCGSGQVIARSDGTVECEFCQAAFTVQVQPEFSAFPQTIDGQPVDLPGMGGTSDNPDVAPDEDDGQAAAAPTDIPGGNETQPPEEGEDDDSEDEPVDSGGNPLFNKKSFRTRSGAAVDRDTYIRHLALGVTDNRDGLLARMRGEKSR